jgi:hypothetical protein
MSYFQVIVLLVDDMLPHASTDVHVLVCDLLQVPVAAGVFGVAVTTPSQRSLAVAEPNAASIAAAPGLQPRSALFATDPVAVITGAVIIYFQVIVLLVDDILTTRIY